MNAGDSMMSFPTRKQFFAAYRRQYFSLPDSMIYLISKYPKSSKVYQKMIQSCKYFFPKNQILVFHCLQIDDDGWRTCSNQSDCKTPNFTKKINNNLTSCKIWIQNRLRTYSTNPNCASELFSNIYQCDAEELGMNDQKLSLQRFLICSRKIKSIFLKNVMLNFEDCSEVPLEEIVANLPNLENIIFEYCPESKNVSSDTVKNLLRIPHFKNMKHFVLRNITEKFDFDTFCNYYKNAETKFEFSLDYKNELSEVYAKKLERFIIFLLGFPNRMRPPTIFYPGQNEENILVLLHLCRQFRRVNFN